MIMVKRARLIYNPVSGHEIMERNVAGVLSVLEDAGYESSTFRTRPQEGSTEAEAARVAEAGFDLIVAAGGDGTINEVVNGIAGLPKRPMLGIIPVGTTNDYARALKIPREDPVGAAKVIAKGEHIGVDIGRANDTYFVNIAGGGNMMDLTYEVQSDVKSALGYLAYLLKGAEMLPRMRPIPMHLAYDDGEYDGEASMFFLSLTNSVGGLETIAPDAVLGDGQFTLMIVKTANLVEIVQLLTMVLTGGRHVNDDRIIYTQTRHLDVAAPHGEQLKVNLDGEYGGDAPMHFVNLKQHIQAFANVADIPDEAIATQEAKKKLIETARTLKDPDQQVNSDNQQ
jgi:diacylglycerol kinase (ATP)